MIEGKRKKRHIDSVCVQVPTCEFSATMRLFGCSPKQDVVAAVWFCLAVAIQAHPPEACEGEIANTRSKREERGLGISIERDRGTHRMCNE